MVVIEDMKVMFQEWVSSVWKIWQLGETLVMLARLQSRKWN